MLLDPIKEGCHPGENSGILSSLLPAEMGAEGNDPFEDVLAPTLAGQGATGVALWRKKNIY
jgi:hypothetical protein